MANELKMQIDEITEKIACTQDLRSQIKLYEERIVLEKLLKEEELQEKEQQFRLVLASMEGTACKLHGVKRSCGGNQISTTHGQAS